MTSFKAKLEKNKENHAYILGVEAFQNGLSMDGPYERNSKADEDWIDGYLDAMFIKEVL